MEGLSILIQTITIPKMIINLALDIKMESGRLFWTKEMEALIVIFLCAFFQMSF